MARKAAPKAAQAAPLDGYTIATSGKFPGTTQAALQTRIKSLGGSVASSVTADTTFLIATEKDYESNSTKIKAANSHNIPIVSLEWLEECESSGKLSAHLDRGKIKAFREVTGELHVNTIDRCEGR
jgi:poly [ADP-ribose] polymerase